MWFTLSYCGAVSHNILVTPHMWLVMVSHRLSIKNANALAMLGWPIMMELKPYLTDVERKMVDPNFFGLMVNLYSSCHTITSYAIMILCLKLTIKKKKINKNHNIARKK